MLGPAGSDIEPGQDRSIEPPARKRRKISTPRSSSNSEFDSEKEYHDYGFAAQSMLMEEIDIEISLKRRLAITMESRIAWALLLQESLANHLIDMPLEDDGADTSFRFQDAAMEALHAIETPCDILFSRETAQFSTPENLGDTRLPPLQAFAQPKSRLHRIRDSSRPFRCATKLLFIRDNTVSPPIVAKMICPDCFRGDFTNLQGLLNHCRLRHSKDYGSHDECMQQCAVIVPEENRDWVLANGTELAGVSLPSLRRLFEIAVGDGQVHAIEVGGGGENGIVEAAPSLNQETAPGNHLTRTLGYHKDTPALAPFLGRAPKRRCINVFDDDGSVDVESQHSSVEVKKHVWRMPYAHRNDAIPALDAIMDPKLPDSSVVSGHVANPTGTRFHIVARVVVSDRSLWLPPGRRVPPDYTHRWMLSVDSPSYSLHITSFLTKVTVTCLTDPPPSTLLNPRTITTAPFAIVGATDKPFLARLTLEWVGDQNPPMEVEHWVELDPTKSVNPVLGDQQVLDVELDRNTDLCPITQDYRSLSWEGDPPPAGGVMSESKTELTENVEVYITTLKKLLPLVPMTMKDVRNPPLIQVPYKLVANPAQFRNLIPGRRKAIEVYQFTFQGSRKFMRTYFQWGRARALLAAYEESVTAAPPGEAVPLTTADVFCWMADEGLFPREAPKKPNHLVRVVHKAKLGAQSAPFGSGTFCPDCGVTFDLHFSAFKTDIPAGPAVCAVVRHRMKRLPILELTDLFSGPSVVSSHPKPSFSLGWARLSSSDLELCHNLVLISDPVLTLAVRDVVAALNLKSFHITCPSPFPLTELGTNAAEIDRHMAPFALLTILTRTFIAALVRGGLNMANQDFPFNDGHRQANARLLTPSHIIRGLCNSDLHVVLRLLLRIGVKLDHTALGLVGTESNFSEQ